VFVLEVNKYPNKHLEAEKDLNLKEVESIKCKQHCFESDK
jgi:hypothetical protein